MEAKVIPAEEGGAGGGAADPNTPEGPATPTAEELKAQMVAKYGQETIDAVCADADTSGWTEQDWEYQIWLYQHREEIGLKEVIVVQNGSVQSIYP